MSGRLTRVAALALLGALLASPPGLVSCAEEETRVTEITIGELGDYTGSASHAEAQVHEGFRDYFRMLEEEAPIPGVRIRMVNYDTRLDYGRAMPGYVWLKGQGAILMAVVGGEREILASRFEEDQIPAVGCTGVEAIMGHDWVFNLVAPPEAQGEAILQWTMDTWDYAGTGRKPKVGHVGWAGLTTTVTYQRGIDRFVAANPGKFDSVEAQIAPYGSSAWAVEVSRTMDCDVIVLTAVGPGTASFVREARARGYEGKIVSGIEAFGGFWKLVKDATSPENLYGCFSARYIPWWNEDVPFITEAKEHILEYHSTSRAEELMGATGAMTGWAWAMYTADAIRRAVEEVGAENVDGIALRNALAETDMTLEGWGNPWRFTENNNCLTWAQTMFEWSIAEDDWVAVSDWYFPPSMPVD